MLAALLLMLATEPGILAPHGEKADVLLFIRSDCPISNRYAPEIERLYRKYSPQNITFHLVYTEPGLTAAGMEKHRQEYGYTIPAVLDPNHRLAIQARVQVTPEAAVFVQGQPIYLGRIDDRFPDITRARPKALHSDLEEVLEDIAAGRIPPFRETKAVGCALENVP
jgi:hypothetical protein